MTRLDRCRFRRIEGNERERVKESCVYARCYYLLTTFKFALSYSSYTFILADNLDSIVKSFADLLSWARIAEFISLLLFSFSIERETRWVFSFTRVSHSCDLF